MKEEITSKEQLRVLLHPANLLKTIGSQVPIASAMVEAQNQLDGHRFEKRIESLEAGLLLAAKINALEAANPPQHPPLDDWSIAVSEFNRRTVDVAVVYDKGWQTGGSTGKELVQPVAHACMIEDKEILICSEAVELARAVASHKSGRVVILAGMAWHEIENLPAEDAYDLHVCRLKEMDKDRWELLNKKIQNHGLDALSEVGFPTVLKYSTALWMGQEIGFAHSGEATNVMSYMATFTNRQVDTSVVSHFQKPLENALKVAVTGVLPGRILRPGSPVFTRNCTLVGIVSEVESYKSDAGRRAVIHGLLGHPRFTKRGT